MVCVRLSVPSQAQRRAALPEECAALRLVRVRQLLTCACFVPVDAEGPLLPDNAQAVDAALYTAVSSTLDTALAWRARRPKAEPVLLQLEADDAASFDRHGAAQLALVKELLGCGAVPDRAHNAAQQGLVKQMRELRQRQSALREWEKASEKQFGLTTPFQWDKKIVTQSMDDSTRPQMYDISNGGKTVRKARNGGLLYNIQAKPTQRRGRFRVRIRIDETKGADDYNMVGLKSDRKGYIKQHGCAMRPKDGAIFCNNTGHGKLTKFGKGDVVEISMDMSSNKVTFKVKGKTKTVVWKDRQGGVRPVIGFRKVGWQVSFQGGSASQSVAACVSRT